MAQMKVSVVIFIAPHSKHFVFFFFGGGET